jgi:hypothetical protein
MGRNKREKVIMRKNPIEDLEKYREFIKTIPLRKYREKLKNIKWVEQDLPKEILPLASIFRYYWEERQFLSFEAWFDIFWKELNTNSQSKEALKRFKKYYFDKNNDGWFEKGFKARMYRTWISILTQLDFCYMFEYVCAKKGRDLQLECNAELDAKGVDAKVGNIEFQVAKISQRKEARTAGKKKTMVTIPYAVFNIKEFERLIQSPRVKDKTSYQKALKAFHTYFTQLKNGFVVFQENYLELIIDNIDNLEKVRNAIEQIALELSGE